jgi:membrane associated rhomboid family serine protease
MANFSPRRSGSPFGDFGGSSHGPILNLPQMTKALLIANVAIHLLRQFIPYEWDGWLLVNFSFIPARYANPDLFDWAAIAGPITSMFLHANWMHVLSNMIGLILFGTLVERAIGPRRMLLLALVTGLLGEVLFLVLNFGARVQNIGASGMVSGLFGAAARMLGRQARGDPRQIWIYAAIWIGLALLPALSPDSPIAWEVHVGGFLAGLLLIDRFNPRPRFRVM